MLTAVLREARPDEVEATIPESAILIEDGVLKVKQVKVIQVRGGDKKFLGMGGKPVCHCIKSIYY